MVAVVAGSLAAAHYHGAALSGRRSSRSASNGRAGLTACSHVRVAFIVRKRLRDVPVQNINTPRETMQISTPEATALDLVGYPHRAGGLNQVATVLSELAEQLDANKLVAVAGTAPRSRECFR